MTNKDIYNLKDNVAIITGGAGNLGESIAHALANNGCSLFIVDINQSKLDRLKKILKKYSNIKIFYLKANLESIEERKKVFSEFQRYFKKLDILINNAAFVSDSNLQGWIEDFDKQDVDLWEKVLSVNLTCTFHLSQLFYNFLKINKGKIINISSIYGLLGPNLSIYNDTKMGNPAAYSSSKGGLIQLSKWLATTLAPEVRVNCISIGGIKRNQPVKFIKRYIKLTPLARMGTEQDVIGAILYFSSDISSWVTGQNLVIDGGLSAW